MSIACFAMARSVCAFASDSLSFAAFRVERDGLQGFLRLVELLLNDDRLHAFLLERFSNLVELLPRMLGRLALGVEGGPQLFDLEPDGRRHRPLGVERALHFGRRG